MKKKSFLPLLVSSLMMTMGLSACGGNSPEQQITSRKILKASIDNPIVEIGKRSKVVSEVAGASYRSSDESIATVDANGNIKAEEMGMAYITVSKQGYYDRVLKFFVDEYETVDYLVEGLEIGPAIVGVKLNLDGLVKKEDLSKATFSVKTNGSNREIESVALCNEEGEIVESLTQSHYIRFNLSYQTNNWGVSGGASCFTYANNVNNWTTNIRAEVSLTNGELITTEDTYNTTTHKLLINTIRSRIVLSTKDWGEAKSYSDANYTLTYKAYETDALREDGVLNPLVIWLHGMGEGGTDPDIALLGNDVTELGNPKIQAHFIKGQQKGAYVLAAQTPTMWMNSGTGSNNGGTGHSIYTQTLKALIDKFIQDNGDIDTKRIYVGGCSNGGYMTMEMAVTYGNFFRAFYPCCEAYSDSFVSDDDIAKLKDLPIWFIHAANDTTVDPSSFVLPTYQRLMRAGAKDVHLSYFVDVRGTEGNPQGNNYMGHYSWIYIFRDEVEFDQEDPEDILAPSDKVVKDANNNPVNLFDWMESMK